MVKMDFSFLKGQLVIFNAYFVLDRLEVNDSPSFGMQQKRGTEARCNTVPKGPRR